MGQISWTYYRDYRTPLTWELCRDMYATRGYKPKRERSFMDKDNRLSYKPIDHNTYISHDEKKNCWHVFRRFWSANRWRKIMEVHANDKWRIFSDTDAVYDGGRIFPDVESVMNLPDSEFTSDHMSQGAMHSLNQMLPCHVYRKKNSYYINNETLAYESGIEVDYQTNYWYPKRRQINTEYGRVPNYRDFQFQRVEAVSYELHQAIDDYVDKFVRTAYRKSITSNLLNSGVIDLCTQATRKIGIPCHRTKWIDDLPVSEPTPVIASRRGVVMEWQYLNHNQPDVLLFKLICRAGLIGRADEADLAHRMNKKPKDFHHDRPFPMYLLYKAMRMKTMFSEEYITDLILELRKNCDPKSENELVRDVLGRYVRRFFNKFLIVRYCENLYGSLINDECPHPTWGRGVHVPPPLLPGVVSPGQ